MYIIKNRRLDLLNSTFIGVNKLLVLNIFFTYLEKGSVEKSVNNLVYLISLINLVS